MVFEVSIIDLCNNLRLDSDAPKVARQARVEGVEKVILCYTDAIETQF
jgi:hypothetical protein